jgi:2-phosphoglycerate kinase
VPHDHAVWRLLLSALYFQAIKGISVVLSGVYLLPTIISQLVTTLASGVLVIVAALDSNAKYYTALNTTQEFTYLGREDS